MKMLILTGLLPFAAMAGNLSILSFTGKSEIYQLSYEKNFKTFTVHTVNPCGATEKDWSRCNGYKAIDATQNMYIRFENQSRSDPKSKKYLISPNATYYFENMSDSALDAGIELEETSNR